MSLHLRLLLSLLLTASACTKSPSPAESTSGVTGSPALRASAEPSSARTPPEPASTAPVAETAPPAQAAAAPSFEPAAPAPGGKVTNSAPWSIQFRAREMSTLHNGTDRSFWILHDTYLQPSRLEVTQPDGTIAAAFDTRATKKFDATIRKENFRQIEPNSELALFDLRVTPQGDAFELRWGPYRIGPLPPGSYQATVIWEARETQYFDDASGKKKTLEGAFVGTVRSPAVPLRLPLP
jgi:hypothetical protein